MAEVLPWDCEIEKVENGFVVSHKEEVDDEYIRVEKRVMEEDNHDEKKCMEVLLYHIAEYFGLQYNKFGKENLNISWDKQGHKYFDEGEENESSEED